MRRDKFLHHGRDAVAPFAAVEDAVAAGVVTLALLALAVALLLWARRVIKRLFFRVPKVEGPEQGVP